MKRWRVKGRGSRVEGRRWTVDGGRWTTVGLLLMGLLSGGCNRWPWEPASDSGQPQASPTTAQSPASSSGSATPFVPDQDLVAKVNGTLLSTTDVELATLELKRLVQAYQQQWEPLSTEEIPDKLDLQDVVNSLVDSELKAQDIRSRGLSTEAKRRLAYVQRSFHSQEWDRWQRERAVPTEEQIHQFYEQNKLGFVEPERIRVRQIVTETLSEAEAVRAKTVQGSDFAQVARDFSVGAGRDQGGDVGWYVREVHMRLLTATGRLKGEKTFFGQLEPMAFALEVGQVSMPVKGLDGKYYVVKLEEHIPQKQRTELEVRDDIKELLTLQHVQQQLEQMRQKAKVDSFPDRLGNVKQ